MDRHLAWDADRVAVIGPDGSVASLPAAWTDIDPVDPFVAIAAGRCPFRVVDLVALADLIDALRGGAVGKSSPRSSSD